MSMRDISRKYRLNQSKQEHDARTHSIFLHPKLIGLEDIIMSTDEVNMFKRDYNLFHQPDNLMFDYEHFRIYNIEYKLNGNREKAIKQLRETRMYLRRMFRNYDIVNLYIHNNYKVEEIK